MVWMNVEEFSARYRVSPHTTYKLVERGIVPFGRVGRRLVFNIDECDLWARQEGCGSQDNTNLKNKGESGEQ